MLDHFQTEKDIDCINFVPMFNYLDEKGIDSSPIFTKLGVSRSELTKPGNMISWGKGRIQGRAIMELVKEVLGEKDPRVFYYIGRESTRLGSLGYMIEMGRKLGNVEQMVRFFPRFNRKFNDIFEMPVYNVRGDSGVLVVHYKDKPGYNKLWIIDQDHWNEGIIAGAPLAWKLPYMDTALVLSRFTIEEAFSQYEFKGHRLEKKGHVFFVNGKEIAWEVVLDTEELERSTDMLELFKRPRKEKILTNKGAIEIHKVDEKDRGHLPKGVIITRDFEIGDLWTIPEGTVFGTEYSRINMRWKPKKKFRTKVYELVKGNRESSENLIRALEEELTESKRKTYEIEKLYKKLQSQIAHEQKLERLMTGGFAHEMRNALAGAQLEFRSTLNYKGKGKLSADVLKDATTSLLENISRIHEMYVVPKQEIVDNLIPEIKTLAELSDHLSGILTGVSKDIDRGLSITNVIREYAKMSEFKPGDTPVDLVALLKQYEHRYSKEFERIGIKYSVEGVDKAIVKAEELHLDSIFDNIIRNAKDALEDYDATGEKEIKVTVETKDAEDRKNLDIKISDNGPGIPEDQLAEIFEPFFSTKPSSGTGLGLGIVKRLVQLYGGEIEVESKLGEGTAFTVTMPCEPGAIK